MANILHGVAGEGMGHATRSKIVITHLLKKGHNVHIVTSNRAFEFLSKSFPGLKITNIHGLILIYENNSVNTIKSVITNLNPKKSFLSFNKIRKIIKKDAIELIITDFEPTVVYASAFTKLNPFSKKIPLISIDNIHLFSNSKIIFPKKFKKDFLLSKQINNLIVPPIYVKKYLITSFFNSKLKSKKNELIPLLIRDEILKVKIVKKDHILVYQTSKSNTKIFDILKNFKKQKFIIYGFNIEKVEGNLVFKQFSEQGFIDDLAGSKCVITNGGFSLISESIFLKKPILSIPIKGQFEQICNAVSVENEGYGMFCEDLNDNDLKSFMKNIYKYKKNLKKYNQNDNKQALDIIDKNINYQLKISVGK